jgi:hypothetical protein
MGRPPWPSACAWPPAAARQSQPPARTPTAAALQQPADRCGAPDKPAKVVRLRTSDGLTLDGASVGDGDLGVVLLCPVAASTGKVRGPAAAGPP